MKTQQELNEIFFNNISKIPKDILDIYYSKKENINWLKLWEYDYDEKINYLESLSKKLKLTTNSDNYIVWVWNANMDYWNSFNVGYRSKDNNISCPFNIIASIPFKYYNIYQFNKRKILKEEKIIIEQIVKLLENEWYKKLSNNICEIETDIVWITKMPYNNYLKHIKEIYPEINNYTNEEQLEYIKSTDYNWPYTVYNLVFWEHW